MERGEFLDSLLTSGVKFTGLYRAVGVPFIRSS